MMIYKNKVVIIGAGLVGSLHAILMAKKGYQVEIFEYRNDIKKEIINAGKSINLALSNRGWKALEIADMSSEINKISIPMSGRKIHTDSGELIDQPYGKYNEAIYSVSRTNLNKKLLIKATSFKNVKVTFNTKCIDINLENNTIRLLNVLKNKELQINADYIFGTDGAFSTVRNQMIKTNRFDYSQTYLQHGYKEILLPSNLDGSHKLSKNNLHIWPRKDFMLIALPNLDGSYTCTLFLAFEGKNSFENLKTKGQINKFFKTNFCDFYKLMPNIGDEVLKNRIGSLITIKCNPWHIHQNVLLLGDAAHAIVPFYGQGMNAGFEDCSLFHEMLENNSIEKAIVKFSKDRKKDGDAIAKLAINNFIEMRDLVADKMFLLRKKIEKRMYNLYPNLWIPLYSQVTFSHISYSDALIQGETQKKIMDEIMKIKNIENIWDSKEIENLIISKI